MQNNTTYRRVERRNRLPSRLRRCLLILGVIFVVGCGGGGSDSGGGSGGPAADFSGTYGGFLAIRISGPGITPFSGNVRIQVDINRGGAIRVSNFSGVLAGQIHGNSFEIENDIRTTRNIFRGLLCRGPEEITGRVQGSTVLGEYTARLSCIRSSGAPGQTNVLFQGPIQATKAG